MWTPQNTGEYILHDCSDGERLESWGDYILVRPDPQAVWGDKSNNPLWKKADGRYIRSDAVQQERCYSEGRLRRALERCGFEVLGFFGDYDFSPASETDERWYVAARCRKEETVAF